MSDDPCFRCTLPDCDEGSPHCRLRQLANRVFALRRAKRQDLIGESDRAAYNQHFRIWKLERDARESEARA